MSQGARSVPAGADEVGHLVASTYSDAPFLSLLTVPAFAARCISGIARGRIRIGHGRLQLVEKIEGTTARRACWACAASEFAVARADVGHVVHCTVLENATLWLKSCNIVNGR
jgi:hypothetical protein